MEEIVCGLSNGTITGNL